MISGQQKAPHRANRAGPLINAQTYPCSCDLCSCSGTVNKPDGICSNCLQANHS